MNLRCKLKGHDCIPAHVPERPLFYVPYDAVKHTGISYEEWEKWATGETGENPVVRGYDVLVCRRCGTVIRPRK